MALIALTSEALCLKFNSLRRRAWKPFNVEFSDILSRFREHRQLFEYEMSSSLHEEALRFYARYDANIVESDLAKKAQMQKDREVSLEIEQKVLQEHLRMYHTRDITTAA
jgi:hypothetical protein